jgi:hypothetical protein
MGLRGSDRTNSGVLLVGVRGAGVKTNGSDPAGEREGVRRMGYFLGDSLLLMADGV